MTKQDLIEKLYEQHEDASLSKAVFQDMIESLFHQLAYALKRNRKFSFPGFGSFRVKKRKARKGRNPRTGELINIDSYKTVVFKISDKLKQKIN